MLPLARYSLPLTPTPPLPLLFLSRSSVACHWSHTGCGCGKYTTGWRRRELDAGSSADIRSHEICGWLEAPWNGARATMPPSGVGKRTLPALECYKLSDSSGVFIGIGILVTVTVTATTPGALRLEAGDKM